MMSPNRMMGGGMMSPNGNGTKQPRVGGGRGMMSPNGMMGGGMMSPNGNGTKQPHVGGGGEGHDVPQWEWDKATTRRGEGHNVPQWERDKATIRGGEGHDVMRPPMGMGPGNHMSGGERGMMSPLAVAHVTKPKFCNECWHSGSR